MLLPHDAPRGGRTARLSGHALPRALWRRRITRIPSGLTVRPRHIARVALFVVLVVVAFIIARLLAERDVRRDSDRRAEVAAVQVRGRIAQAASLTESLRRFMLDVSGTGVTSDQFARNALRWLSPARFSAAAWVEQVPDSRRAAYERRIGHAIVTPDERHGVVPSGSRAAYLPATLVSGFPPMGVPGIDLRVAPGMAAALTRASRLDGVAATPLASSRTGTSGLFLVAPAPNLRPGYVAVFVSEAGLRAAATDVPAVQVRAAGISTEAGDRADTSSKSFTAAGQRFTVAVPREPVQGAAAILPWVILAGGLVVAGLAGALGLNAARRARAQQELDRIFTLSQDLITVADFDGRFTRVNPAAAEILGYTEEELLARPYVDLVHPADRDSTAAEADSIARGEATVSFENRFVRKDGSIKVLDWTSDARCREQAHVRSGARRDRAPQDRGRGDATRRRAGGAAARRDPRRAATRPQAELFTVIAEECARLFGTEDIGMVRYEGDRDQVVMASSGTFKAVFPAGSRHPLGGDNAASLVFRTGRPARIDDYGEGERPDRGGHPPGRPSRRRGHADHAGGPALGRHDRGDDRRGPPATGDGVPPRAVHRADRHRDRQHRSARPGRPAGRGAGRPPAGGDAGREGGAAAGGVRQGRRGTGDRPRRRRVLAVPRRRGRNRERGRAYGRRRAGGRPSGHAAPSRRRRRHRVRAP